MKGGVLTPAACMGMALVKRLRAAGVSVDVRELPAGDAHPKQLVGEGFNA